MRREFGGCAGNIAYTLKMLGGDPLIMATVGDDFGPYAERLEKLRHVGGTRRQVADQFTAQAFITTDLDDNQITAFHPGAMMLSHQNHVRGCTGATLGIVAPDGRDGMLQHAREFHEAGIPFIFDPGQGLPMFSGPELLEFIAGAHVLTVNDYEARVVEERTGRKVTEIAATIGAVVVTRGAEGCSVYAEGEEIRVAAVKPEALVDPTGCGDAFRGGLLHGMSRG